MVTSVRFCFLMAIALIAAPKAVQASQPLTFEKHVRPILRANCFQCHGEEDQHEGSLDLRLVRLISKGGDSGPVIVPGKPDDSLIVQRLTAGEMPPEGKGKPLSAKELETIRTWIEQGAKTAGPEPDSPVAVADDEKSFWSFQPLQRPNLPSIQNPISKIQNPIDAFLLADLNKHNLTFSPAVDRRSLLRRAFFDLHGLPPSPADVDRFLADDAPDAFEKLLDRLLASPRYGERWGRHWLDVAGYADSDGYTEKDPERKYAYKYRDYVIRSLNADKPWNQFLVEQLAGDELLKPPYTSLSAEHADLLAATGFLRMAPDGTADGGVDQAAARNDVMAETIKIVSSSLLGLTVGCAQCHNHRYDPIPQTDYYRFRAIFEPAYDVKNWRKPAERLVSLWSDEVRQQAAVIDADLKKLADERNAEMDKIVAAIFESEVAKLPEEQRELAKQARDTAAKDRTDEQKQLLKDHPSLNVSRGSAYLYDRKKVDALNKDFDERQKALQAKRPAEDFVPCLTEVPGKIPQTFVFYRGDVNQPKQSVEPGELSVLANCKCQSKIENPNSKIASDICSDDPSLPTSGRRLAYARWLTSGQQPLVPRVLVNRIWLLHFGRGIVATPGDFGQLGARPSNGDGFPDIIIGAGPGATGGHVKVFDGTSGSLMSSFFAYGPAFRGGVFVAVGDLNGDGTDDIITGAGPGAGPHVKAFSGDTGALLNSFFAYAPSFRGGVRVAAGDVNGDGFDDIITGAGSGGNAHVKVFSGDSGALLSSFLAYPGFSGGVFVAAGDFNGDGKADIVTGADRGAPPHVKVFDGATTQVLASFFAYAANFTGGVRVATGDVNGDGIADIITGAGPGAAQPLRTFDGISLAALDSFFALDPRTSTGFFVAGSR